MGRSDEWKSPLLSPERASKQVLDNAEDRDGPPGGERHGLPTSTRYLPLALGGSRWCGKKSLQNVVVFGGSYCKSTNTNDVDEWSSDTWVNHVCRNSGNGPPFRVRNFAFPGATAEDDLPVQFSRFRMSLCDAPLNGERTTYFFFLGINDCGRTPSDDLEPITEVVFDLLHDLYTMFDARNFVLINVPPIDRSPGAMALESNSVDEIKERVRAWNKLLMDQAEAFANGCDKATVFVFSSHQVLNEVLDEPVDFDFSEEDPETEGAGIWADDLHVTPAVHAILAERLLDTLIGG